MIQIEKMSKEQRMSILNREIQTLISIEGWKIVWREELQMILEKGKKTRHWLHLLLSIFIWPWVIGWTIISYRNRKRILTISVDEYGNVVKFIQESFWF